MKNLIVQIFFDKSLITGNEEMEKDKTRGEVLSSNLMREKNELFEHSQILARRYAERIGADYVLFDEPWINFYNPTQERFRLVFEDKWAEEYDNIMYIDCDAFIYHECPNIFELYPQENFRVVRDMNPAIPSVETKIMEECGIEKIRKSYFNAGMIIFHSSTLKQMKPLIKNVERFPEFPFGDQSELNYVTLNYDIPHTVMDQRFNSFHNDALIAHLYGPQKVNNTFHLEKACKQAQEVRLPEVIKIPESWGKRESPKTNQLGRYGYTFDELFDHDNLFYDCLDIGHDRVICIGPPLGNIKKCVSFTDGKVGLEHSFLDLDRVTITLVETSSHVIYLNGDIPINVNRPSSKFSDRNMMVCKMKNEPIRWIKDWIQYHYNQYGIDGFVIYNNQSTEYDRLTLRRELSKVSDKIVVDVLDIDMPFGPSGYDYMEYIVLEHVKYKYAWCANSLINHDIDELLVIAGGKKLEDLLSLMNSNRIDALLYGTRNMDPYNRELGKDAFEIPREERHFLDYTYYGPHSNNDRLMGDKTHTKWICLPNRCMESQWLTHMVTNDCNVKSISKDQVYMAHFHAMKSPNNDKNAPGDNVVRRRDVSKAEDKTKLEQDKEVLMRLSLAFKNRK